jgi:uncharacterized membrane protein YdjX (TVP38/TMEM64 family)
MDKPELTAALHRRRRLAALAVCAVAGLAMAAWGAVQPPETWVRAREMAVGATEWVRGLGAGWFFAAFAVLPAVGFPVSVFAVGAGSIFGPVLGLPVVLAFSGLSMAVSMTISYGLARFVVRPWVGRLLGFLGYGIPVVPAGRHRVFVFLVRVTPGAPYVFQSLLLGLAGVPFGTYLAISWAVSTATVSLMIVFGDALMKGEGKLALAALGGVVVVAVAIKLVREKLAARESAARTGEPAREIRPGGGA